MGLFRNLGERVERLKREVESAAEDEATHVCGDCGTLLYADRPQCPDCGADAVEPRDGDREADSTDRDSDPDLDPDPETVPDLDPDPDRQPESGDAEE